MNAALPAAVVFMLAVAAIETRTLARSGAKRDIAVFYGLWVLALAAIVGQLTGLPMPKPLEWARALTAALRLS